MSEMINKLRAAVVVWPAQIHTNAVAAALRFLQYERWLAVWRLSVRNKWLQRVEEPRRRVVSVDRTPVSYRRNNLVSGKLDGRSASTEEHWCV
jgi:hypothetical protein